MRIWLIGAGQAAIGALEQLHKNPSVEIVVSAQDEVPPAVREGAIARVDYIELVTPFNVNVLARRIRPDLILIDSSANERNYGRVSGGSAFSEALTFEIVNVCDYPCLVI